MKLGTEVGLGAHHIVLDGDAAPPQKNRGTAAPLLFTSSLLMPLGTEVDLDTGHIVSDRNPAPLRGAQASRWIKKPLGMEVGLGPGHSVLDGDPAPLPTKGAQQPPPLFGPCLLWPNAPISVTAELLSFFLCLFHSRILLDNCHGFVQADCPSGFLSPIDSVRAQKEAQSTNPPPQLAAWPYCHTQ